MHSDGSPRRARKGRSETSSPPGPSRLTGSCCGTPSIFAVKRSLLRDSLPVADWNGDGIDDLIVGKGQDQRVLILFGGKRGLNLERSTTLELSASRSGRSSSRYPACRSEGVESSRSIAPMTVA